RAVAFPPAEVDASTPSKGRTGLRVDLLSTGRRLANKLEASGRERPGVRPGSLVLAVRRVLRVWSRFYRETFSPEPPTSSCQGTAGSLVVDGKEGKGCPGLRGKQLSGGFSNFSGNCSLPRLSYSTRSFLHASRDALPG